MQTHIQSTYDVKLHNFRTEIQVRKPVWKRLKAKPWIMRMQLNLWA